MKRNRRSVIIVLLMMMTFGYVYAQKCNITQVELDGTKLNIYYDLLNTDNSSSFIIKLFSSHDNFAQPLTKVMGDVGLQVKPGSNRKIVWDIADELGDAVEEKIRFRINGILYEPFIKLEQTHTMIRRNKEYKFTWIGGLDTNTINVELLKGDIKIMMLPSVVNAQDYTLRLPSSLKIGSYRLRISDAANEDNTVFTNEFLVKRKIPIALKILPIVVIGSVFLLVPKSPDSHRLPDPIKP